MPRSPSPSRRYPASSASSTRRDAGPSRPESDYRSRHREDGRDRRRERRDGHDAYADRRDAHHRSHSRRSERDYPEGKTDAIEGYPASRKTRHRSPRLSPRYERERGHRESPRAPSRRSRSPESGRRKQRDRAQSRSRSPDFERQRQRERARYDQSTAAEELPVADVQTDEQDVPDFQPSGLLAKESNQINGTALKYHEPSEAKRPKKKWRLYVFKGGEELDVLHVSQQSCYLFGRDRGVADIPLDHSSCSKQHAVLQYRLIVDRNEFGDERRNIKPFVLDLESANGTTVNSRDVPPSRYYELKNGDTIRFAASEREWVLLCEDA
ncbi:unnamed protein product [Parajaminaea phylloscopi]